MSAVTEMPQGITGRLVLPAKDYSRNRTAWLLERRNGLGASEISAILGLNNFVTPLMVWESKVSDATPTDDDMPEAAFWGLKNEHNVASVFATRHRELGKLAPTPGLLAHPEFDHLRATLDKLLVKRRTKPAVAVAGIECKTVGDFAYKNYWLEGVPPTHIQLQTQFQMGVSGLDRIYVPHLIGGNNLPEPYIATRDDAVIEQLFTFADAWWQKHIVGGERPVPTLGDAERMSEIFPARPPAESIQASSKVMDLVGKHIDAKRREKEAETEKKTLAFEIQNIMGDAEEVLDGKDLIVTWKRPKQSFIVDEKKLAEEEPDIYRAYLKPKKSSRTFTTKEIDR